MPVKLARHATLALLGLILPLGVWAQTTTPATTSPPAPAMDTLPDASVGMSERLMCQTVWLFQSEFGLILGLALAALGLWLIIRGSGLKTGLILIIGGALLSALPTLATSFLGGLSTFLVQTHLSNDDMNGPMSVPLQSISNCSSIPVDTSGYSSSSTTGILGQLSGIDPLGAQATQGATGGTSGSSGSSSGGSSSGGGSGSSGTPGYAGNINKNAPRGGLGCGQLVDHGIPTSPFDMQRMHPIYHRIIPHKGTDIGCRPGATIHAGGSGQVVFNGFSDSYGNRVEVKTNSGHINTYNHMSSRGVATGTVNQGDTIGPCGATGHVTGPHLHFEVKDNTNTFVDPVSTGCQ